MFLQIYGTVIFPQTNRPVTHNVDELECLYDLNFLVRDKQDQRFVLYDFKWHQKSSLCFYDGAAIYNLNCLQRL